MKSLFSFTMLVVFCGTLFSQSFVGKIIAVKDGDTVVILWKDKPQPVRLAHIDAPEKNQPYGAKAKKFVSDFCFGKTVTVVIAGKPDRNGRWIAEIFYKNQNLNKHLVRNGLAWHYKQYSNSSAYAALELAARRKQLGLWKDPASLPPWRWRKLPNKQRQTLDRSLAA